MKEKQQKEIISCPFFGNKSWVKNRKIPLSPYVKFSFFGFILWGDLIDDEVNDWYFMGIKLSN